MDHHEYIAVRGKGDEALKEAIFDKAKKLENEDRRCFSQGRDGYEVVGREDLAVHPHKSLLPLFDASSGNALDAFKIDTPTADDANVQKRAFAVPLAERVALTGQLAVVPTISEFRSTFMDVFSEGLLRYVNWNNVFAAGGGVLACAQPIPAEHAINHTTKRKYFHDIQYAASDVDLFLYGLDEEQGKQKLIEIYNAVSESCPHTVVCFRSAHAVTLVSQYPFRHIQIVLRLYSSPYEVLAGFDVDACTVGYDGKMVYADVRAHHALVTRRNTIDVTRRSPSYEMRLAKYGVRGFEVEVNNLKRDLVDPGIFERPWNSLEGLAKLLVLEKLRTPEQRTRFFEMQKLNREGGGRSASPYGYFNRRFFGRDAARTQERMEEKLGGTAEVSNYSTVFLPWGPGHNAESTMSLMAKKDFKLNSRWFMFERPYRLHPCFFGTAEEILRDCSKDDPPFPSKTDADDAVMREHRETYVRGPLTFIADDPGRQRIGSFHPLSEEGWSEGLYFLDSTEELFAATNANDRARILKAAESTTLDVRDFFGRTALHLGLMSGNTDAVRTLLEIGANPLEPMAGGRTVFHLAAMYGRVELISALRDAAELAMQKREKQNAKASAAGSDDAKRQAEEAKKIRQATKKLVQARDGDAMLSPLQMALLFGRLDCAKELLKAGAILNSDPPAGKEQEAYPCDLVTYLPEHCLDEGLKLLIQYGYSCASMLDYSSDKGRTELMNLIEAEDEVAVEALSRLDPTFKDALVIVTSHLNYPLSLAISFCNPVIVDILIKAGSPVVVSPQMVADAKLAVGGNYHLNNFKFGVPAILTALNLLYTRTYEALDGLSSQPSTLAYDGNSILYLRGEMEKEIAQGDQDLLTQLKSSNYADQTFQLFKICHLLLASSPLDNTFTIGSDYSFSVFRNANQLDLTYWLNKKTAAELAADKTPPAISVRDYASLMVGKILHRLDRIKADKLLHSAQTSKPNPALVIKACDQLLSAMTSSLPCMAEQIRGWSYQAKLEDVSSKASRLEGLEPDLHAQLNEYATDCMKRISEGMVALSSAVECKVEVTEFYRSGQGTSNGTSWDNSRRLVAVWHADEGAAKVFPTVANLFPSGASVEPAEVAVKTLLEKAETENPIPQPIPSLEKVTCNDAWALAGVQRNIFRLASRSYFTLFSAPFASMSYDNDPFPRRFLMRSMPQFISGDLQPHYGAVYNKIRSGETFNLGEECERRQVQVASADVDLRTPLIMAILAGNLAMVRQVLDVTRAQYVKPESEKTKKKGKAPARINNLTLLEDFDDGDLSNDDDEEESDNDDEPDNDEDEDEEPDEDEDEEPDEDAEDDDNEGADEEDEAIVKPITANNQNVLKTTSPIKPEMLFCVVSSLTLDESRLPAQIKEDVASLRVKYAAKFGKVAISSTLSESLSVTPLQLAIVLNDIALVTLLLEEARKISPKLVRSLLSHTFQTHRGTNNTVNLAIALDRSEILTLLIEKAGYGLSLFTEVAQTYCVGEWSFKIQSDAVTAKVSAADKPVRYNGLRSSLYGATKRTEELKRDPKLTRLTRVPYPNTTLLHFAASCGSIACVKYLAGIDGNLHGSVKQFLGLGESSSIRELIASMREKAPTAFAQSFGTDVSLENDTKIVIYTLMGGNLLARDSANRTPLHVAAIKKTLLKLVQNGGISIPNELVKSHNDGSPVVLEERIRFPPSPQVSIGEFYPGGSLLTITSKLGHVDEFELLVNLGFDPAVQDAHFYGYTALQAALESSEWDTAKAIAKRLKVADLFRPSAQGITPLMIAARSGSVQGLLAVMNVAGLNVDATLQGQILSKTSEGETALHVSAITRHSEAAKLLVDWIAKEKITGWLSEDFTSGRTSLDYAIAAHISQEPKASTLRRLKAATAKPSWKSKGPYVEKVLDGAAVVSAIQGVSKSTFRNRAFFSEVRPARERRLEAVTMISLDEKAFEWKQPREDYTTVYGAGLQAISVDEFLTPSYSDSAAFNMVCRPTFVDVIASCW